MPIKWSSKFELRPGKWVFVPTPESIDTGKEIKRALEKCWIPPPYYFHLRAGGHVEALRSHLKHSHFLRIDIQDFFGSINRTRVTRSLKKKFPYKIAREYANASTVPDPSAKRIILPFGFVQSQIVAAVCLAESALGIYLDKLKNNSNVELTVYVDDIIVSSSDNALLDQVLQDIKAAADKARFILNPIKQEGPASIITAFNVTLMPGNMEVDPVRLKLFQEALAEATSKHQIAGIRAYVMSVNTIQGLRL